jgi:hypothetical protein
MWSRPTIAIATPDAADTTTTTAARRDAGRHGIGLLRVTEVRWSNDRGGSGVAAGTTSWSVPGLALQPGANVVTVNASDAAWQHRVGPHHHHVRQQGADDCHRRARRNGAHVTKGDTVSLAGTSSDEVGVTDVVWANNRGGSGSANGKTNWTIANVALQPGVNVITVTARDAAGNAANATLSVTRDSQVPTVAIVLPTTAPTFVTNRSAVAVSGKAADNSGGHAGDLAEQPWWSGHRGRHVGWNVASVALLAGANVISVTASDAAGNTTTSTVTDQSGHTCAIHLDSGPTAAMCIRLRRAPSHWAASPRTTPVSSKSPGPTPRAARATRRARRPGPQPGSR